jgi:hypothetical protein
MAIAKKESNYLIKLDIIVGLRAWGLILYGALPSNLALVGALEVKIGNIDDLNPFYFIAASILPIFLLFMLIRDRHKEWYLTTDFLNLRSTIVTIIILILATLISGISGIIHNRYIVGLPQSWSWNEWTAIAESFLLAVTSLVVSSALFMTAIAKESNLPGLPTVEFVKLIEELQRNLRYMKNNKIWETYISIDDNELIDLVKKIELDLIKANTYIGNRLAIKSLKPLQKDMTNLIRALENVRDGGQGTWEIYFEQEFRLSADNKKRRTCLFKEEFDSIERLKGLKLGT